MSDYLDTDVQPIVVDVHPMVVDVRLIWDTDVQSTVARQSPATEAFGRVAASLVHPHMAFAPPGMECHLIRRASKMCDIGRNM